VSSVLSYALCPGCSRWTVPPTGFEPASSWRSNAPTRRSPRAVGQPVVRRAMTPVGVLCGRRNAPPRRPHAWGKPTVTASRIRGCPLCQPRKTLSEPAPRVLPRGIEPLYQLNLERKQSLALLLRFFDDSSDKERSRCPVCVPARGRHAL
jgi:hypothetical protein